MNARQRWRIEGTLTSRTPLHVGSGEVIERAGVEHPDTGARVEINAVAADARGLPYLPATALRGVARGWIKRAGAPEAVRRELFGSTELGGRAVFEDGFVEDRFEPEHPPPHWEPAALTGVTARVAIDRRTRSAAPERLFHDAFVPAGVRFQVAVDGELSEEEAAWLLAALGAFDDPDGPALGAGTADGWGRMVWTPGAIRRLDTGGVRAWLRSGAAGAGWSILPAAGEEVETRLTERASEHRRGAAGPAVLGCALELAFEGPLLVNDPSRCSRKDPDRPDHHALLDARGFPYLPASSFRGALRSHAERILRTVAGPDAACGSGERPPCRPPATVAEVGTVLCPACRLFGAAGWRSPLAVTDFTAAGEREAGERLRQEFVAIDRFTGGAASRLKFDAVAYHEPVLRGLVTLDPAALDRAGCGLWALGLVALTLRDLCEGDIGFGFGAAKGYGRCRAVVLEPRVPSWTELPKRWRADAEGLGVSPDVLAAPLAGRLRDPDTRLGTLIEWSLGRLAELARKDEVAS